MQYLADWWVCLARSKEELQWSDHQLVECWCQLKTVLEERDACEDVETEAGARHSDNQTSHIADNNTISTVQLILGQCIIRHQYSQYQYSHSLCYHHCAQNTSETTSTAGH